MDSTQSDCVHARAGYVKEGNLCRWHPPVEREGAEDCVYLASFRPELNEHKQAHIVFETLLQQLTHTFLTASELGGTEKRPAPEGNSKAGGTGVWECACDMQRMCVCNPSPPLEAEKQKEMTSRYSLPVCVCVCV